MLQRAFITFLSFLHLALAQNVLSRTGWTPTADSFQSGINPIAYALDGNMSTFWHSQYSPTNAPLPHTFTIDMKTTYTIGGLQYLPRQDGNSNGNIGQHQIDVSLDGTKFSTVGTGVYIDDKNLKQTLFQATMARYIRLTAISEAGNRGPWTSAAEINVLDGTGQPAPPPVSAPAGGFWGATVDIPLVPVASALLHGTGSVLVWSSFSPYSFGGANGKTVTAIYNPSTGAISQSLVTNTGHDMFCPGISVDGSGRVVVTGGDDADKTSIYDPSSNTWITGGPMVIARGYQASATLSDGRVFTIGGSWSGPQGGKNGEVYSPATNAWTALPNAPVAPMLTNDAQGVYRADNHAWLFGWKSGSVFQAGPSHAMNWYGTSGTGSQSPAGSRGTDGDAMCGNAVMYDAVAGKILTMGGSPSYQNSDATTNAHVITIGTPGTTAAVTQVGSMAYARAFANGVVLPDGTVFVVGGQPYPVPFSDTNAALYPELYNPATASFSTLAPMAIPRVYHSQALLLPNGTVFVGGGGLCGGCATNHFDAELYTPPYLYTASGAPATRPVVSAISAAVVRVGATFTLTVDAPCQAFSMVRYGSSTHTVNTDQRRVVLVPVKVSGTTYTFRVPADSGVALPGYWMVWALRGGVPSVAREIQVTN